MLLTSYFMSFFSFKCSIPLCRQMLCICMCIKYYKCFAIHSIFSALKLLPFSSSLISQPSAKYKGNLFSFRVFFYIHIIHVLVFARLQRVVYQSNKYGSYKMHRFSNNRSLLAFLYLSLRLCLLYNDDWLVFRFMVVKFLLTALVIL